MLSFAISSFDLIILIGGGFGAICVIMGVIAYASIQTMKSVKAESKWKELAIWGSKKVSDSVNSPPASLPSIVSRLSLQTTFRPQFQLAGPQISPLPPISLGTLGAIETREGPKQELIPWWDSSNPTADTLINDSSEAVPDFPLESSSLTSAAPPPFGDEVNSKTTKMAQLPRQEYRIVIGNGLKSPARARRARQGRKNAQQLHQTSEMKKESGDLARVIKQDMRKETEAITLPAPPPPIEQAITPPLALSTSVEEIETPVISKRNVRSLIKKSRSGFN